MRKSKIVLAVCFGIVMCLIIGGCSAEPKPDIATITEEEITEAILNHNEDAYLKDGETACEGHIALGTEGSDTDEKRIIYALVSYGYYGFVNGNFEKTAGSGVIPTKLTFEKIDNKFSLTKYEVPEDGSGYAESAKRLFPKEYHERILSTRDGDREVVEELETAQAEKYLKSIGREAKIGYYGDFEHVLFTECGMSVEASNNYISYVSKSFDWRYPDFIGTKERVEDGIRYIYSAECDKDNDMIVLKKYKEEQKDSAVCDKYYIEMKTGQVIAE